MHSRPKRAPRRQSNSSASRRHPPPRSTTIAPPTPIACPFASAVVLAARSAVFDVSKVASPNDGGSKSGAAIGLALMVSAANRRRQSARALNVGLGRQRIGKAVGRLADLSGACVGVGGGCEEGREAHGDELHRRSDILAPSAASLAAEILDLAGHLGSKVAQIGYDATKSCRHLVKAGRSLTEARGSYKQTGRRVSFAIPQHRAPKWPLRRHPSVASAAGRCASQLLACHRGSLVRIKL
jgi:hypothetical protein